MVIARHSLDDFLEVAQSYDMDFVYSHEEDGVHLYGDMDAAEDIIWAIDALECSYVAPLRSEKLALSMVQKDILMPTGSR